MALPAFLLKQIEATRRPTSAWFSLEEIKKRDKDIEIAARYVQRGTDNEFAVRRTGEQLYTQLDKWAARLLENEVRLYEERIWKVYSDNLYVPTTEDDASLREEFAQYINGSAAELKVLISEFSKYAPTSGSYHDLYSELNKTVKALLSEYAATGELRGELLRLESIDTNADVLSKIGYAQIKIERFFSHNYAEVRHPFVITTKQQLSRGQLQRAVRLLTYVIFKETSEERLKGFEQKFTSIFLRYLSCPRDSSGAIATVTEQVGSLLEPFLKKIALLFYGERKDEKGTPLWHKSLEQLIKGLGLCTADLKNTDERYWTGQSVSDAALRVAFKLRHIGAHEAHGNPPYENERLAYFVFASLLLASHMLLESNAEIAKRVDLQGDADAVRDLCVKIEELTIGPDGPRISDGPPNRLKKLLEIKTRVEAIWPTCSISLRGSLESEYLSVKSEVEEAEREESIESYLDSMRDDEY
jgi:hypothetical protein